MVLIIKSNIKKVVKELQRIENSQSPNSTQSFERDKENLISSVAEEVELELEKKVEDILRKGIKRAKANNRKTLQARDL